MKFQLDHMCSTVRDMDYTIKFYQTMVDATVINTAVDPETKAKHTFVQIANGLMEFTEPATHDDSVRYGLSHVGFSTDDLDASVTYFTDLGYVFTQSPKAICDGNGRHAFFTGPSDVCVELIEREHDIHIVPAPAGIITSFDHYAINVAQLPVSYALYHDQLQLGHAARFVFEQEDREIMFLGCENDVLEVVCNQDRVDVNDPTKVNPAFPIHSHIALRVDDIHEAYEKFAQRGYQFPENAIVATGIQVGGMTMNLEDPSGTRLEIMDRGDLRDLEQDGYCPENHPFLRHFN